MSGIYDIGNGSKLIKSSVTRSRLQQNAVPHQTILIGIYPGLKVAVYLIEYAVRHSE